MQSKLTSTMEREEHLLPSKNNDQRLRRVYSDSSSTTTTDEFIQELILTNNTTTTTTTTTTNNSVSEVEKVECECCGMSEDCTPTYIGRVKEFFCGKWICGLCSEAVKEKMKRTPPLLTMEEALESHMALCKQFNRTTRLNPKLSLAGTMREIARKSSLRRSSKGQWGGISRSVSCVPRMSVEIGQPSI